METFKVDDTIQLFKVAVSKQGNIRYPGIYNGARPLEVELRNSNYCRLIEKKEPKVLVTEDLHADKGDIVSETKKIQKGKNITTELKVKSKRLGDVELVVENSPSEINPEAIKINETEKQALVDLDGVGEGTADKVIEFRELSPFVSYQDLNERVPLRFGRNWKDFYIEFD